MSCSDIQAELVEYHFGETPMGARGRIEEHLLDCRECLKSFLGIKREIETASLRERPSDVTRARLRRAVADEVAPKPAARAWSWWERPAAFLAAGATVLAALAVLQVVATSPGAMPHSLEGTVEAAPPTLDDSPH